VSTRGTEAKVARGIVDTFLGAYNDKDLERISPLLDEQIHMVHYGRNVDVRGAQGVLALLARSAEGAFPDRRFHPPRRRLLDGPHVVVEHSWSATAQVDVPGFASAGEAVAMDLCTIFTLRNERIVGYAEYG
jgi:predicted ester cyclase